MCILGSTQPVCGRLVLLATTLDVDPFLTIGFVAFRADTFGFWMPGGVVFCVVFFRGGPFGFWMPQ